MDRLAEEAASNTHYFLKQEFPHERSSKTFLS